MTETEKSQPRTVNERGDDPDARPMLYDPLQGGRTTKTNQYLATVIVCLSAAAAGTGLSWTSPVEEQLSAITKDPNAVHASPEQNTWIASLLAIGAIVGAVPSGIFADQIGRKKTAMLITIPYIISWLITVFATNIPMLYAARFLIGIAIGGSCVVCPVYISEYAETSIRGMLGTCFQLFLTIGILFVYILGYFKLNWVLLSWFCLPIPILNLIGLCFIHESPTWLLKNRRDSEAATAIKWYWGRFCNANNAIQAMKNELDSSGNRAGGIRELFSVNANRNGFIICVMLMFFQQFSGINAVIFFAQTIFEAANTGIAASLCTLLVGIVQVAMTFVAAVLVERAGRRMLLIISSSVMLLCLATLGFYFYIQNPDEKKDAIKDAIEVTVSTGVDALNAGLNVTFSNSTGVSHEASSSIFSIGLIPLASMIIFIVSFSLGYGPIPWMMMGEMLAADIKGIATSLTVEFNWISVFIVTKSFGPLKDWIGIGPTFWIFSVIMAAGTLFGIIFLFETKGKSNTEIQMKLAGDK